MALELRLREMRKEDIPELLNLYNDFTKGFVGSASRTKNDFRRRKQGKDNLNWVAISNRGSIVGYVHAHYERRFRRGEFADILVHSDYDFVQVAKPLIEKIQDIFVKKKVLSIGADSMRNPEFDRIFPSLGFFESESMGVFMYAILDVQKFLNELQPVLTARLKNLAEENILIQIECEGNCIFLRKTNDTILPFIFTNLPVDFKVVLDRETLTKLVFGIADAVESLKVGQLKTESKFSPQKTNQILKTLFPKRQFLIMDFW